MSAPVSSARFLSTSPGEIPALRDDVARWRGHVAAGRIGARMDMAPELLAQVLANEAAILGPDHPRGLAVLLALGGGR